VAEKLLEWSPRSRRNLTAIRDYIISQENPTSAQAVVTFIVESADILRTQPMIGKPINRPSTRELVLTKYPYTLVYKIKAGMISIAAVVHQAQFRP
jgi:toxin ParE1/3/4